jgi:hypothetical protein
MKTISLMACVVFALLLLAQPPRPVTAEVSRSLVQEDRDQIIQRQFDAMIGEYAKHDTTLHVIGGIKVGDLKQKESYVREFQFEADKKYTVLGACDSPCKDLNILVHDEDGSVVAKDDGPDDHPITHILPKHSGSYKVETVMVACDTEPCRFGVGVYVQ